MSEAEATSKGRLFERCHQALDARATSGTRLQLYVPGRVEFLGKHTDYAGGRSLLCAVERGICVVASPREDRTIAIRDVVQNLETEFAIGTEPGTNAGEWSSYPMIVARRLAANFGELLGADIALGSDLPQAAGLSSSSALVIASFLVLAERNDVRTRSIYVENIRTGTGLAEYLGCIENGSGFRRLSGDAGVGTSGGSQDHTAILLSQPGQIVQYRFAPLEKEAVVAFPEGHQLVVAASGVLAEKIGAARSRYNRGPAIMREILRLWETASGTTCASVVAAGTAHPGSQDEIRAALRELRSDYDLGSLLGRFEQVMMESTVLIPDAAQALRVGDLRRLGEVVALSQLLAERLLENQVPETVALVALARELGAFAASAFGAGFGGSVWALVEAERAGDFRSAWAARYAEAFPNISTAEFLVTGAGPACGIIEGTVLRPVD